MELCMIHANDLQAYIRKNDAILVDLRSEEDYREYHIRGAIHIPAERLAEFMKHTDKNRTHIFYCRHGSISIQEGKKYARLGYRICSLAGGMDAFLRQTT
ncbi:MAG: rhodanese-like domain-containing protein [Clostridiales bacterium]|nr:rhodanese-like domain-containing protein [Clostridiales bacterium]